MSYKIIVLLKQVPDTTSISAKPMKEDGTLNRAELPSIVNPEDMNALEMALSIKEQYGGFVYALTMGPPSAADVLREAMYRGADRVILLTDRKFAASDTLATSHILSRAIKKIGKFDLILCGRQAIDGNTAQVGPQVADKLCINQLTYVDEIANIISGKITALRVIEDGREIVESDLPLLITVMETANIPRPPSVKRIMRYNKARAKSELRDGCDIDCLISKGLLIEEWDAENIEIDSCMCGAQGSPTRVYKIRKVELKGKEFKKIEQTDEGIEKFLKELIQDYTFD